MHISAKKKETQDIIKKHDEFETKIVMDPRVNNVALKHALMTYIIKPIESNKFNYEKFINDMAYNANIGLTKQIRIKHGIRAQFTLLAIYLQMKNRSYQKRTYSACNVLVNGCVKFGEKVELPSVEASKEYIQFKSIGCLLF